MTPRDVTLPLVLAGMVAAARTAPVAIGLVFTVLTSLGVYVDTRIVDDPAIAAFTLGITLVTLGCQLWVMRLMIGKDDRRTTTRPAIFGLLLLGTVMTIGISLGLLLFLLPGLYLAARWRAAVPLLLAQDGSVGDALNASWRQTRAAWRPLMLASAIVGVPFVGALAVFLATDSTGMLPLREAIVANGLLYAATIGGWTLDMAAYRLVASPDAGLAETFA